MERGIKTIETETDRAGKSGVSDDEFRDLPRRDLAEIDFPIRLQRAAGTQDRHPLDRIDVAADALPCRQQDVILNVEESRGAIGPLQQFPDPDEVPAFAMRHGRVGNALEQMRAG